MSIEAKKTDNSNGKWVKCENTRDWVKKGRKIWISHRFEFQLQRSELAVRPRTVDFHLFKQTKRAISSATTKTFWRNRFYCVMCHFATIHSNKDIFWQQEPLRCITSETSLPFHACDVTNKSLLITEINPMHLQPTVENSFELVCRVVDVLQYMIDIWTVFAFVA